MEALLKNELWDLARKLGGVLLLLSPMFFVCGQLIAQKRRYQWAAASPFTGQPLRPPGESLRLKIQDLDDKLSEELLILILFPGALAITAIASPRTHSWLSLVIAILLVGLFVSWRGRKLRTIVRTLWDYRLGFDGERVVGETLNQLMLDGYRVFHDIPFDRFNIDHVIVGPPGVYAVETKTRRKPFGADGRRQREVEFDGETLHWPRFDEKDSTRQALLNASSLGKWLTSATGETTKVHAVLTIPGWMVVRRARAEVNVLNPDEIQYSFPKKPENPLSPEQIQRIVHQLTEKCRLPADSKT